MAAGIEVHGEVTSADATAGVEIVLYRAGTLDVVTLGENEFLDIHYAQVVTDTNTVVELHCSATAGTVQAGSRFVWGEFAANGGTASEMKVHYKGKRGNKAYVHTAAAANVYVIIQATIRRA